MKCKYFSRMPIYILLSSTILFVDCLYNFKHSPECSFNLNIPNQELKLGRKLEKYVFNFHFNKNPVVLNFPYSYTLNELPGVRKFQLYKGGCANFIMVNLHSSDILMVIFLSELQMKSSLICYYLIFTNKGTYFNNTASSSPPIEHSNARIIIYLAEEQLWSFYEHPCANKGDESGLQFSHDKIPEDRKEIQRLYYQANVKRCEDMCRCILQIAQNIRIRNA